MRSTPIHRVAVRRQMPFPDGIPSRGRRRDACGITLNE